MGERKRLTKKEREILAEVLDFVLAGELDEDLWSEADIAAMKSAQEKLSDG